jgi:ribonuclease Y
MLVIAAVLISVLITAVLVVVVLRMLGAPASAEARREAETIRREAKIEAREEAVRLRQDVEREVADQRGRITKIEERVIAREDEVERRQREVERREQGLADREIHVKELQEDLKQAKQRELEELERVAGMTVSEAKARLLGQSEELVRHDLARPRTASSTRRLRRRPSAARGTSSPMRCSASPRATRPETTSSLIELPVRRHEGPDHRP